MSHVMVDLETLSTRKDAAVIQIGAVYFDPYESAGADGTKAPFSEYVWDTSGRMDLSTVLWWMRQDSARNMAKMVEARGKDLPQVLDDLGAWYRTLGRIEGVWSHGASFDLAILSTLYESCGKKLPWDYRLERALKKYMLLNFDLLALRFTFNSSESAPLKIKESLANPPFSLFLIRFEIKPVYKLNLSLL